jgi:predicted lipid-binding transport protein (Tim44 family)
MKKVFVALLIAVSTMSMVASNVEAKRLGGGGSIGKQSTTVTRQATPTQPAQTANTATNAAKPAAAPTPTPAPVAPPPASPWKGMLGGALLGLGAGALLSHFGLGGAMGGMLGSILMIALLAFVVMFIVRMFRNKSEGNYAPVYDGGYSTAGAGSTPNIGSRIEPTVQPTAFQSAPLAGGSAVTQWSVPADFDVPAFLRNAKTYFIRLQASWDKADIKDIREFTTPEMFAELKMQLQERGASPNVTDVVTLGAELLGVETVNDDYVASVKFSGMIKESETAEAAPFEEVWNMSKPTSGQSGWVLAGIQQLT